MVADRREYKGKCTKEEVYTQFKSNLNSYFQTHFIKGNISIYVFMPLTKIRKVDKYDAITLFINDHKKAYKFIVVESSTPKVTDYYESLTDTELIFTSEIIVSRPQFALNPIFELLTEDEQNAVKNEYGDNSFPIIKQSDPMARYYNLKIGEIVRVLRSSTISSESVAFRICSK
jgi:DNA-directed RNA polymerase subunit H (RpoH/RPB5)